MGGSLGVHTSASHTCRLIWFSWSNLHLTRVHQVLISKGVEKGIAAGTQDENRSECWCQAWLLSNQLIVRKHFGHFLFLQKVGNQRGNFFHPSSLDDNTNSNFCYSSNASENNVMTSLFWKWQVEEVESADSVSISDQRFVLSSLMTHHVPEEGNQNNRNEE